MTSQECKESTFTGTHVWRVIGGFVDCQFCHKAAPTDTADRMIKAMQRAMAYQPIQRNDRNNARITRKNSKA